MHTPPVDVLRAQLAALEGDLYPTAVKVGMLGSRELAKEVGAWLRDLREKAAEGDRVPLVVVDPVMISTSGHKLVDDNAISAMIELVFPYSDLITPNKFEAEELLGRKLHVPEEVESGARELLAMGPRAVLIKGGHSLREEQGQESAAVSDKDHVSVGYAQDYLLMSTGMAEEGKPVKDRSRLCDGSRGVWLRSARYDTVHTHGTGCTLSSAIATAWAMGQQERQEGAKENGKAQHLGALSSMHLADACCIAKAYVTAGIARGVQVCVFFCVCTRHRRYKCNGAFVNVDVDILEINVEWLRGGLMQTMSSPTIVLMTGMCSETFACKVCYLRSPFNVAFITKLAWSRTRARGPHRFP